MLHHTLRVERILTARGSLYVQASRIPIEHQNLNWSICFPASHGNKNNNQPFILKMKNKNVCQFFKSNQEMCVMHSAHGKLEFSCITNTKQRQFTKNQNSRCIYIRLSMEKSYTLEHPQELFKCKKFTFGDSVTNQSCLLRNNHKFEKDMSFYLIQLCTVFLRTSFITVELSWNYRNCCVIFDGSCTMTNILKRT